jgi:hypothetical protein
VSDRLVVTGFAGHGALDGFVRSEIRYFRSRDMRAWRSEAPGGGPALLLDFRDNPDLEGIVRALSGAYPELSFAWEPGRPDDAWPVLEEIYSTF